MQLQKLGLAFGALVLGIAAVIAAATEYRGFLQSNVTADTLIARVEADPGLSLVAGASRELSTQQLLLCMKVLFSAELARQGDDLRLSVYDRCEDRAEQVLAAVPTSSLAHLVRGIVQEGRGNTAEALSLLAQSRALGPNESWIGSTRLSLAMVIARTHGVESDAGRAAHEIASADIEMLARDRRSAFHLASHYHSFPDQQDWMFALIDALPELSQNAFLGAMRDEAARRE